MDSTDAAGTMDADTGFRWLRLAWAAAALALGTSAAGAEMNWQDVESRIQYAYYTENPRALGQVLELLGPGDASDALRGYYAGLADYRLSQLKGPTDPAVMKQSASACVSELDKALAVRADFADALALQSVCLDLVASLQAWRAPFAASRSGSQIEKARHLQAHNPRVLLLGALGLLQRARPTPNDRERALAGFREAAAAFEAERQEAGQVPGWGASEAWWYLAQCYLDQGSALQARDALERALLLTPEFAQAHRLMTKITTGS